MGFDKKISYAGAKGVLSHNKEMMYGTRNHYVSHIHCSLVFSFHIPSISKSRSKHEADFIVSVVSLPHVLWGRYALYKLTKLGLFKDKILSV